MSRKLFFAQKALACTLPLFSVGLFLGVTAQRAEATIYTYDNTTSGAINASTTCAAPLTRNFSVLDSFTVQDVNLGFNADHAYRGDIQATLRHPDGTSVQVITSSGGDNNLGYDVLLDSDSSNALNDGNVDLTAAPLYDRTAAPSSSLDIFDGKSSAGTWILEICDTFDSLDDGTFNSAQLVLDDTPPPLVGDPIDYGDAPDSYATDATDNSGEGIGASHTRVNGVFLGTLPDGETDAATPLDGTGDGSDEDGITFFPRLYDTSSAYAIDTVHIFASNTSVTPATLHAWIDFNRNGSFEAVEHTSVAIPAGVSTSSPADNLIWQGLSGLTIGDTYARFRLTTDSSITANTPGGLASDGEVEDYLLPIQDFPESGNGGICNANYNLVYSGEGTSIVAVHVDTGTSVPLTASAPVTVNGLSTDHVNRLVYYGESNSLYAWSPITNTHSTVTSNFSGFLPIGTGPTSLSSGGAAFYNGSVYQGSDINSGGITEIYKVDFVPSSNGLTIDTVTPIGIDTLVQAGTLTNSPDWGDFIIDDTGLIIANSNGGEFYWSYDLNTGTFTDLVEGFNTNSQLAKDGQGRLWALGAGDTFQVSIFGDVLAEVSGTRKSTPSHSSADAAECVRGTSSIGDRVWADTNGDGVQDGDEDGIENVTVDLIWDLDGDGVVDSGEPVLDTQTTGTDGIYDFSELIFGDYIVQVTDTNSALSGTTLTSPSDTVGVTLAAGTVDNNDVDFGYQPPASADLLLVKRITAINGQTTNPNDSTDLTLFVDDTTSLYAAYDNHANWPADYLVGELDAGLVQPGDEIEYTVYFLNAGNGPAEDVRICDRLFPNQTLVTDAYGSGVDAQLQLGTSAVLGLTSANDANDRTEFIAPSASVDASCNLQGTNDDGTLVVDVTGAGGTGDPALTALPGSDGAGSPNNSYGLIRFRTQVTP